MSHVEETKEKEKQKEKSEKEKEINDAWFYDSDFEREESF